MSKSKANSIRRSPASVIQTPPTNEIPTIEDFASDSRQDSAGWSCPASQKSLRTTNPIRAIVDPIVASSLGKERDDGKEHISLAVSFELFDVAVTIVDIFFLTYSFVFLILSWVIQL